MERRGKVQERENASIGERRQVAVRYNRSGKEKLGVNRGMVKEQREEERRCGTINWETKDSYRRIVFGNLRSSHRHASGRPPTGSSEWYSHVVQAGYRHVSGLYCCYCFLHLTVSISLQSFMVSNNVK